MARSPSTCERIGLKGDGNGRKKATPISEAAPNLLHSECIADPKKERLHLRTRLARALQTSSAEVAQRRYLKATDAAAQRSRVLDALRTGPKSTIQLRREWDVMAPAARVLELRRRGFEIVTHWVDERTECGLLHRVASYLLARETGGEA